MCVLVGMGLLTEQRSLLLSAMGFYWWWWWRRPTAATITTQKKKTTIWLYFNTHSHTTLRSWSHWVMWDPCTHAFNAHRPHSGHILASKSSYTFTDWWIDCVNGNHKNQIDDKRRRNETKPEKETNTFIFEVNSSPFEIWWKKNYSNFGFCQLNHTVRPSDDNNVVPNEEFNVIK